MSASSAAASAAAAAAAAASIAARTYTENTSSTPNSVSTSKEVDSLCKLYAGSMVFFKVAFLLFVGSVVVNKVFNC